MSKKSNASQTTAPSYRVKGSQPLTGTVRVPGDKSISHRALMLGAIATGTTRISGLLEGEDCLNTARVLRKLGVHIDVSGDDSDSRVWTVQGVGPGGLTACDEPLDVGNSGTGMRLLAGLLAGQGVNATLVGDRSLMGRPMERIAVPLRMMGVDVTTSDGKPPLVIEVNRRLVGIDYVSPVASAQVKSAVMLAGLGASSPTSVTEPERSRDHTERMLPAFGCPVEVTDGGAKLSAVSGLSAINVEVPGDISSAAFLLVAASIIPGSDITIEHVGMNPTRTGIIKILRAMGASIDERNARLVHGEPVSDLHVVYSPLSAIDVPPEWVPSAIDEFPVVFIAAAAAKGLTRVTGVAELKVKESDRLGTMASGLASLGANLVESDDGLEINGGLLDGGAIHSHDDHRIAMAFTVAGALTKSPLVIHDVTNVTTSFPRFSELMKRLGMDLEEIS
ncbi:MAG: 3-phosphoshikimate 1-carboxyvinyltransferase [Gammaproteobacteria bacterium]